jgi:nucleoside-diphosphate-sugar epimerase
MTTRRRFLGSLAAAGMLALDGIRPHTLLEGATGGGGGVGGAENDARRAPRRILILGGTSFLGPHLVRYATERGHHVTIFTRGRREPALFEESFARVDHRIGDRSQPDGLAALRGGTWDAVIDTSGHDARWTRESAALLRPAAGRYLYVSSTGVFLPYRTTEIAESGPIPLVDSPPADPPSYGVMKALSENETRAAFGDDAMVVRPGYIVGPGDGSDRWTYWPVRIARGGEILVTGRKTDPVQYIDVRDLTEWMIHLIEDGDHGHLQRRGAGAEADARGVRLRRGRHHARGPQLDVGGGLRLAARLPVPHVVRRPDPWLHRVHTVGHGRGRPPGPHAHRQRPRAGRGPALQATGAHGR